MSINKENKEFDNKSILYTALMRHKKGLLLVIFIAMISSTFAWFYLNLQVGVKINGEVDSWNINTGESAFYQFGFENLHPGVTYTSDQKAVPISNDGATDALLNLTIKDIYLFGKKLQAGVDYKVVGTPVTAEIELSDETTRETEGTKYTIYGFPFDVDITFPTTRLKRGESANIQFSITWPENGDLTPFQEEEEEEVEGEGEGEGAGEEEPASTPVPVCLNRIISPTLLANISSEIEKYEAIGVNVVKIDDSAEGEELVLDDRSITTCDIIDTYFGAQADDFNEKISSINESQVKNDFYYYSDSELASAPEGEYGFPTKALYIELTLTITQAATERPESE